VNVAARTEAQTRETDDSILITGETWKRLSHQFEAESRGRVELRGVSEPVALYAPRFAGTPEPEPEPAADDGAPPSLAALARRVREATLQRARR
jgi:class 3 adenylate cyclase